MDTTGLLTTRVTFINKASVTTRKELYEVIGNNALGELFFKKGKTMWFEGNEYKVLNVSFKVEDSNQQNETNCEVIIEIDRI